MKGKKLQVLIDEKWEFVFCREEGKRFPVITKDESKAITEKFGDGQRILDYFGSAFGSLEFRLK